MTTKNFSYFSCELYYDISKDQLPIVYDEKYNVSFGGFENLHSFDVKMWRNVVKYLKEDKFLTDEELVKPLEAKKSDLLLVHSRCYLNSLKWSAVVAVVIEAPIVALVPNYFVQKSILKPLRLQTGGSVLAGKLALERGWAINIGGGFHHCWSSQGGGFCPYADITLTIACLFNYKLIKKAMIVDLDAHQGNGHERDFLNIPEVYILDMYNKNIYPRDRKAKKAIKKRVELKNKVDDLEYLLKLRCALREALNEFTPDIVVYNAGTDILYPDPFGCMYITEHGVLKRDEIVFTHCKERKIPIVMLTSGGYLRKTARIIANSIINLERKGLINRPTQERTTVNVAQNISEPTVAVSNKHDIIVNEEAKANSDKEHLEMDTKKQLTLDEFLNESVFLSCDMIIEPPLEFRGTSNIEPIPFMETHNPMNVTCCN